MEKITIEEWRAELESVRADVLAGDASTIETSAGEFAYYDDGSIFPMTESALSAMNADIDHYAGHPNDANPVDSIQEWQESCYLAEVGGSYCR